MKRATIIYNPSARSAPPRDRLLVAARQFKPLDWEIDLRVTEAAGHATQQAQEAAAGGSDVVIACGGDGTVNEVVNGLVGSAARFAVIRGGTGNVFAKEIGVPRDPFRALQVLVNGDERSLDLGLAGERYFLAMGGVGLDASVVRHVPTRPKRLLGTTAYVIWGLLELRHYRKRLVSMLVDGELREIELYWLLLGNTRSYGGVLDITSKALADDGMLDTYVFSGGNLVWLTKTALRLVLRRHDGATGVSFQRASELEIITPGIPVQADGEDIGDTPMRFSVASGALRALVPPGQGLQLFTVEAF